MDQRTLRLLLRLLLITEVSKLAGILALVTLHFL
jgi:hypothetical protein